jgi:hypothetical protein
MQVPAAVSDEHGCDDAHTHRAPGRECRALRDRRMPHRHVCFGSLPLGPSVSSRLRPRSACRLEAISGDPLGIICVIGCEASTVTFRNTIIVRMSRAITARRSVRWYCREISRRMRPHPSTKRSLQAPAVTPIGPTLRARRYLGVHGVSTLAQVAKIPRVLCPERCRDA